MPSLDPPLPIAAVQTGGFIKVTFDRDLLVGGVDPSNWTGRSANKLFTVTGAIIAGGTPRDVGLTMLVGGPEVGDNVVHYAASPADIISDTVVPTPAAAFTDFPLTV